MRKLYSHQAKASTFYIAEHERQFHALLENWDLGGFQTSQLAVNSLIDRGFEPGIPDDITDWERVID